MTPRAPVFAPAARADLRDIGLYIARDNPKRAMTFVAEPRAQCRTLADQPERNRTREEYGPGIRVAVHRAYLILYAIRDDGRVVIERVLHGARDLDHLLGD